MTVEAVESASTMKQRKPHHVAFKSRYGDGVFDCFWCGEPVDFYCSGERGDFKSSDAFVVHHIDHNHSNNDPANLAPGHYGCHIAYHRSVRPLVALGDALPPEWRDQIAEAVRSRNGAWSSERYAAWIANVVAAAQARMADKTPVMCECGRGPFVGPHGLATHRGRSCTATGATPTPTSVLGFTSAATRVVVCHACGDGPFENAAAFGQHRQLTCPDSARDRTIPIICGVCSSGPFRGEFGLRRHKSRWCGSPRKAYEKTSGSFACDDCGKKYRYIKSFKSHQEREHA